MQRALTRAQKVIAYSALAVVLAWTGFGAFVIWLLLTDPKM